MRNVSMLSYNSVVKDARIVKEADSLQAAGYSVTVFGFVDGNHKGQSDIVRPSGVKIKLVKPDVVAGLIGFIYYNYRRYISQAMSALVRFKRPSTYFILGVLCAILLLRPGFLLRMDVVALLGVAVLLLGAVYKYRLKLLNIISKLIVRVLAIVRKKYWDDYKADALFKAASGVPADIIHAHDLHTMAAAIRIKQVKNIPLVWDAHEIYEEVAQLDEKARDSAKIKVKKFQGTVDYFITINDSIAAFYKQRYPELPEAVIVKNATPKFEVCAYDGRLHAAAEIPREQKIILYQGGYVEKRGLRQLVAAAAYLNDDMALVMMGWGRLEQDLRDLAGDIIKKSKRQSPPIVFIPPAAQEELPKWTSGAYIGLIPYEHHGLNHLYCTPNKLWEYPNAGVPILCTPMVEMRKVVEASDIGWVLDVALSPNHIATLINSISLQERNSKSENCLQYIERDNWSTYADRLVSMYSGIEYVK